jgi:hypothetical protein
MNLSVLIRRTSDWENPLSSKGFLFYFITRKGPLPLQGAFLFREQLFHKPVN